MFSFAPCFTPHSGANFDTTVLKSFWSRISIFKNLQIWRNIHSKLSHWKVENLTTWHNLWWNNRWAKNQIQLQNASDPIVCVGAGGRTVGWTDIQFWPSVQCKMVVFVSFCPVLGEFLSWSFHHKNFWYI